METDLYPHFVTKATHVVTEYGIPKPHFEYQ